MYAVVYQFKIKENKGTEFIKSWKELTALIYKHEGSLGSRLHKQDDETYIAYALWPNEEVFGNSGNKLPKKAKEIRKSIRESCFKVERLLELKVIEDLLKHETYVQR